MVVVMLTLMPCYIRQVNVVKLVDIMFSLLCVCLCALSPIGFNGRNDVLYSTHA